MLTKTERAPFKIEVSPRYDVDSWGREFVTYAWRLIGADGECLEKGGGFATEATARLFAERVARNEMA